MSGVQDQYPYILHAPPITQAVEIVEIIMTQHWDLAACQCWVCMAGRKAGCRPREKHLGWRDKYDLVRVWEDD